MKRITILIGLFLVFSIIAATFYFKASKSSEIKVTNKFTSSEYGFSVNIPEGYNYRFDKEPLLNKVMIVEVIRNDDKIAIPIFAEERNWELVYPEVTKNFKQELIKETTVAGQPAFLMFEGKNQYGLAYYSYRIKHPNDRTILLGTASLMQTDDTNFKEVVESVLYSIAFQ